MPLSSLTSFQADSPPPPPPRNRVVMPTSIFRITEHKTPFIYKMRICIISSNARNDDEKKSSLPCTNDDDFYDVRSRKARGIPRSESINSRFFLSKNSLSFRLAASSFFFSIEPTACIYKIRVLSSRGNLRLREKRAMCSRHHPIYPRAGGKLHSPATQWLILSDN